MQRLRQFLLNKGATQLPEAATLSGRPLHDARLLKMSYCSYIGSRYCRTWPLTVSALPSSKRTSHLNRPSVSVFAIPFAIIMTKDA